MEYLKALLIQELVAHFGKDARRIDHALQVTAHAEALLAETPEADAEVVLAAGIMHDFGIREAERLHGYNDGPMQEKYGPPFVRAALRRMGMAPQKVREVCAIVARHHSPPRRPSVNFLLLYESDWLVNLYDFPKILSEPERVNAFIEKNFHTPAGKGRARRIFQGEDSIFARMGNVYALMIDEEKRRAVEEPYLLALAEEAWRGRGPRRLAKGSTRVLDLACGTGFHARMMARAGYSVTAIDFSHSMLAYARARESETNAARTPRLRAAGAGSAIAYAWSDLLKPLKAAAPAGLTLLLGNTLSVFAKKAELGTVLANAATATQRGCIVVCQVLNYGRFAAQPPAPVTRSGLVDGRETVLTKSLRMVEDESVLLTFTASQRGDDGAWHTRAESSTLRAWARREIEAAARAAGLVVRHAWGSLAREVFDAKASSDLVIEFEKR